MPNSLGGFSTVFEVKRYVKFLVTSLNAPTGYAGFSLRVSGLLRPRDNQCRLSATLTTATGCMDHRSAIEPANFQPP
ncbi:hypothetical protein M413DRAFT_448100 [Hebeloma cylindrosporum]|uniref:Uncharacterized protein n=1 Tax=Hebeloma cylindrosporum TaxID=76867 RepID=A0A0C3BN32_HEBCY|nr:hypothetical protein M413DRAFT_448100 [Hebeloma cylindrosporum h7]